MYLAAITCWDTIGVNTGLRNEIIIVYASDIVRLHIFDMPYFLCFMSCSSFIQDTSHHSLVYEILCHRPTVCWVRLKRQLAMMEMP